MLERLCNTLLFHKKRLIMKAFIESQFAYFPLGGLFHSRALNTKIDSLHYRALSFVHRDESSTFQELLIKDNSVSVHHRNIQFKELLIKDNSVSVHHRNIEFLAKELFKVISGHEIFTWRVIPVPANCPCRLCWRCVGFIWWHSLLCCVPTLS